MLHFHFRPAGSPVGVFVLVRPLSGPCRFSQNVPTTTTDCYYYYYYLRVLELKVTASTSDVNVRASICDLDDGSNEWHLTRALLATRLVNGVLRREEARCECKVWTDTWPWW